MKKEFFVPPDIAMEIGSPDQRVSSLVRRCIWYVAHGVRVALLIEPEDEIVFVFRPNQLPQAVQGKDRIDLSDADRIDLSDVIPDLEFGASDLFDQALRV